MCPDILSLGGSMCVCEHGGMQQWAGLDLFGQPLIFFLKLQNLGVVKIIKIVQESVCSCFIVLGGCMCLGVHIPAVLSPAPRRG